jgi:hypothetical protein
MARPMMKMMRMCTDRGDLQLTADPNLCLTSSRSMKGTAYINITTGLGWLRNEINLTNIFVLDI